LSNPDYLTSFSPTYLLYPQTTNIGVERKFNKTSHSNVLANNLDTDASNGLQILLEHARPVENSPENFYSWVFGDSTIVDKTLKLPNGG